MEPQGGKGWYSICPYISDLTYGLRQANRRVWLAHKGSVCTVCNRACAPVAPSCPDSQEQVVRSNNAGHRAHELAAQLRIGARSHAEEAAQHGVKALHAGEERACKARRQRGRGCAIDGSQRKQPLHIACLCCLQQMTGRVRIENHPACCGRDKGGRDKGCSQHRESSGSRSGKAVAQAVARRWPGGPVGLRTRLPRWRRQLQRLPSGGAQFGPAVRQAFLQKSSPDGAQEDRN